MDCVGQEFDREQIGMVYLLATQYLEPQLRRLHGCWWLNRQLGLELSGGAFILTLATSIDWNLSWSFIQKSCRGPSIRSLLWASLGFLTQYGVWDLQKPRGKWSGLLWLSLRCPIASLPPYSISQDSPEATSVRVEDTGTFSRAYFKTIKVCPLASVLLFTIIPIFLTYKIHSTVSPGLPKVACL